MELQRDDEFLFQCLSTVTYAQALRDYLIGTLARVLTSGRKVKNWFVRNMVRAIISLEGIRIDVLTGSRPQRGC